jgi:hypothetical protein
MRNSLLTQSALGLLAALVFNGAALAQCPAADAFEPNDDCASATALAAGITLNLTAERPLGTEAYGDYYTITVPASTQLDVTCFHTQVTGDIDLYLYSDLGCSVQVDSGLSTTDNEDVTWQNNTAAAVTVTMKTRYWDGFGGPTGWTCDDYSFDILLSPIVPSGCAIQPDDALAPNQDCNTAAPLTNGLQTGLWVFKTAPDYFSVVVPDGGTIIVDALFSDAAGDIDMELYDSLANCAADISVDYSGSVSDNENVTHTNISGGPLTYYVHVYQFNSTSNQDCNTYDLNVDVTSPVLGTAMCFGDGSLIACPCGNESTLGAGEGCKNSLGYGSILSAGGSASVAADDITFTVTQARPNQTGMLVQGSTLISVPFKDGVLCAGNPTDRLEVVTTDAAGTATTVTSIVTSGAVAPGDTRWYQIWSRDPGGVSPCGTGSNFTNGMEITYVP